MLRFDARAQLEEFVAALEQVVARHDILRTSVAWEGLPQPVQVVWRHAGLPVTEVTLPGDGDGDGGGGGCWRPRAADGPGARAAAPAWTWQPSRTTGGWLALLQFHHLILDHTGLEVVLAEIAALLAGQGGRLPEPVPFRDFVAQARLGVPREEHERYFAGLLGDVTEPTAPFGLLDVRGVARASRRRLAVDPGLAGRVREPARAMGASPATVFHLAWARVLAAVAGRDDVVFGTVLLGRMDAGAGQTACRGRS